MRKINLFAKDKLNIMGPLWEYVFVFYSPHRKKKNFSYINITQNKYVEWLRIL